MGKGRLGAIVGAWMQDDRKRRAILAVGAILIALLFLSSILGRDTASSGTQKQEQGMQGMTEEEYIERMEARVEELLSGIDGVGKLDVMLTLESSSEYVYQSETRQSSDRTAASGETTQERQEDEETIVMVEGEDGRTQALIRTERTPKIQGIAVVCEGAGQASVEQQIIDVLTTTFGISSARVSVAKAAPSD